ncbi:uncharacterized protein LOC144475019 isoform X2 [Augochlora pura]
MQILPSQRVRIDEEGGRLQAQERQPLRELDAVRRENRVPRAQRSQCPQGQGPQGPKSDGGQFWKDLGPFQGHRESDTQTVLPGPRRRHVGTGDTDQWNRGNNGLRGAVDEAGEGADAILQHEAANFHPGSHAAPTQRGSLRETTVPVQHDLADVQAVRQGKAEETHVLPRQRYGVPPPAHPENSPARELWRRSAENRLYQRRLVPDFDQMRGQNKSVELVRSPQERLRIRVWPTEM